MPFDLYEISSGTIEFNDWQKTLRQSIKCVKLILNCAGPGQARLKIEPPGRRGGGEVAAAGPTDLHVPADVQRVEHLAVQLARGPAAEHVRHDLDSVVLGRGEDDDLCRVPAELGAVGGSRGQST